VLEEWRHPDSPFLEHQTSSQGHHASSQEHRTSSQGHHASSQEHRTSSQGHHTSSQGQRTSRQGHQTSSRGHQASSNWASGQQQEASDQQQGAPGQQQGASGQQQGALQPRPEGASQARSSGHSDGQQGDQVSTKGHRTSLQGALRSGTKGGHRFSRKGLQGQWQGDTPGQQQGVASSSQPWAAAHRQVTSTGAHSPHNPRPPCAQGPSPPGTAHLPPSSSLRSTREPRWDKMWEWAATLTMGQTHFPPSCPRHTPSDAVPSAHPPGAAPCLCGKHSHASVRVMQQRHTPSCRGSAHVPSSSSPMPGGATQTSS